MIHYFWIVLISLLMSGQTEGAIGMLDTIGPEDISVLPGQEAILTCKTDVKFKFCSFHHIATMKHYTLSPEINGYEDGTILFEDLNDPEKTTCGMKITKVKGEHSGEWRCDITAIVDGQTKSGHGTANIIVNRAANIIVDRTAEFYFRGTKPITTEDNGVPDEELNVAIIAILLIIFI